MVGIGLVIAMLVALVLVFVVLYILTGGCDD